MQPVFFLLSLILFLIPVPPALADCTQANDLVGTASRATGVKGGLVYDLSNDVLKTCDGTNWKTVGGNTASPPSDLGTGSLLFASGTANALYTPYAVLNKGVYYAMFYNCLSNASQDSYVNFTVEAQSGTVADASGSSNRLFSQLGTYSAAAMIVKVRSATASVRFKISNPNGGTLTNAAATCTSVGYTQIGD